MAVALPVGLYIVSIYALYIVIVRKIALFHLVLLVLTAVVLAIAVWLAEAGYSMANCLLVVTLAPLVTVVGYEVAGPSARRRGHRSRHWRAASEAAPDWPRNPPSASFHRPSSRRAPCGG